MKCPTCRIDNPDISRFCSECGAPLRQTKDFHAHATKTLEITKAELTPGSTFAGRYQVIEELGKGGMGKVYKVFDKEISAKVALKVLKPEIVADQNTIQRFRNELKLARDISHKNICRMYDLGKEGDLYYITMEYVPGEDLKNMIRMSRQLGVGTAIIIAGQICDGLAEAHRNGTIHRDLKPSNIMIDREGNVRIMDFGIARSVEAKGLTGAGTIIGTPEYMSPEQIEDKDIDQRSDIYSLGIILYEMLTGRVPFEGDTAFAIGMKHKGEIPRDPREINPQIPESLSRLVLKCLEKSSEQRYQTADEARSELEKIEQGIPLAERVVAKRKSMTSKEITVKLNLRKLFLPSGVLVALLLVAGYFLFRHGPEIFEVKIDRTQRITHDPGLEIDPAISPDGKMIAYAAGHPGKMSLYVRQIAGGRPIALTDSLPDDSRWPRWSSDGTQIVFQSQGSIYIVAAFGGIPKKLEEPSTRQKFGCAAWSPDGKQISYVDLNREAYASIWVRSLGGGEPTTIAEPYEPHSLAWSPDGSKIAYASGNSRFIFGDTIIGNLAPCSIWVVSTKAGHPVRVTDDKSLNVSPAWMPDGRHLLYVSSEMGGRDVYLAPLDSSGQPLGASQRLTTGLNAHTITLSSAGDKLAYSDFSHSANIWSIRIPQDGPVSISEAQPVTTGNQAIEGIDVSPDGKWLAYDSNLSGNQDIYKIPVGGGEPEQLTDDPSDDFLPAWSPDGQEIAFYSFRKGNRDLFLMAADGGKVRQLTEDPAQERYPDWSPDGNQLVYYSDKSGRHELYVLTRKNRDSNWQAPRQLTYDGGSSSKWSPDGRFIAYISGPSLRVVPVEGGDPRTLIESKDSSILPIPGYPGWSKDSRTIYYKAYNDAGQASFWSVPVSGGKPELLVRFDDPSRQSTRSEFASDGEIFYFTLANYESDIWVGELTISRK
ncbi:MAG TPA: protein kinase [Candidatus Desulfaltia sp.]|nr:protein kinase [Candidatus Desulfaltia sp.]